MFDKFLNKPLYLGSWHTCKMELLCENSKQLNMPLPKA